MAKSASKRSSFKGVSKASLKKRAMRIMKNDIVLKKTQNED